MVNPRQIISTIEMYEERLKSENVEKRRLDTSLTFGQASRQDLLMHAHYLCDSVKENIKKYDTQGKANRHFAAVQMCLSFAGWYTLEELMEHNRKKKFVVDYPVTHTFTVTVQSVKDVSRSELLDSIVTHLDDFGYGDYWEMDDSTDDGGFSTVSKVMVEDTVAFEGNDDETDADDDEDTSTKTGDASKDDSSEGIF